MQIKYKLRLGTGLLFAIVTTLAVIAARQVNILAADSRNVLINNYNSVEFTQAMLEDLDHMPADSVAAKDFSENLKHQLNNMTEFGEKQLTYQLRDAFNRFQKGDRRPETVQNIRNRLYDLESLNMSAIRAKGLKAEASAESTVKWIVLTGTICFLIAFTLFVNLPGHIANPISRLTESIKEIASGNYTERLHLDRNDEFGQLANSFNTMAEKLQEYNSSSLSKLMTEKKRIDTLINNMQDPVIGLDEHKKVIFANEQFLKITALSPSQLIGKNAYEVALRSDLLRLLFMENVLDEKASDKTPIQIYSDGKESYFEKNNLDISIVPPGETASRSIGDVIVLRNITPYKELDFAKTNFIASVSHELKTPVASIKMSLDLLKNDKIGSLNSDQSGLLESIKEDANRILKITGALLNITQVESGHIQLNIDNSPLSEIVSYAIKANETAAEAKKITFKLDQIPDSMQVVADPDKSTWAITNLISNAIRYSYDHSHIYVHVNESSELVKVSIKDTGSGISPEYQQKVFDRYFRIPGTSREGTGLGLAISKEFIEAQGGTLTLESELGAGSTFTATFVKAKIQS